MEKLSFENKELYLLGDYYNIISSNLQVPDITLPTRITSTSRTLIDNIFSNNLNFVHAVSGNLTKLGIIKAVFTDLQIFAS